MRLIVEKSRDTLKSFTLSWSLVNKAFWQMPLIFANHRVLEVITKLILGNCFIKLSTCFQSINLTYSEKGVVSNNQYVWPAKKDRLCDYEVLNRAKRLKSLTLPGTKAAIEAAAGIPSRYKFALKFWHVPELDKYDGGKFSTDRLVFPNILRSLCLNVDLDLSEPQFHGLWQIFPHVRIYFIYLKHFYKFHLFLQLKKLMIFCNKWSKGIGNIPSLLTAISTEMQGKIHNDFIFAKIMLVFVLS